MIDNQKILYKFIQTNKNVDWYKISYFYKLSENFIREFQDKVDSKFKKELKINNKSIYIDIRRSLEQILMEVVDTKEQFDFRHTDVIYCWSRRYCSKRS